MSPPWRGQVAAAPVHGRPRGMVQLPVPHQRDVILQGIIGNIIVVIVIVIVIFVIMEKDIFRGFGEARA